MKKIILGLSALILIACNSPLEENGSRLCPSDDFEFKPSDFKVEKIIEKNGIFSFKALNSDEKISFDSIGLRFSTSLTEKVEWELTITSKTSLTKKTYKDYSDKVDIYWYGNSDKLPFFGNEQCEITFRILCSPLVKIQFEVMGKANFKKPHPNFGILLRDFDGNGLYPEKSNAAVNDVNNGWFDANVTFSYETEDGSPMGDRYLRMFRQATDKGWYLGAHSIPVNTADKKFQDLFPTTNTDSIFLNFFIRADKHQNTNMEIGLRNPGTGLHLASGPVNWQGWKLVSRSFSNLKITNGARAGLAIPAADLFKINDLILQLGASPKQTNILEYDYDFIFISFGSPLAN